MNVSLPCECGQELSVSELQAGMQLSCQCGRRIIVPTLGELRRMTGSPISVSPTLAIEALVMSGELPTSKVCAGCGKYTNDVSDLLAVLDSPRTELAGRSTISAFGGFGFGVLSVKREYREISGRSIRLPIRLCQTCHARQDSPRRRWPAVLVGIVIALAGIAWVTAFSSMSTSEIIAIGTIAILAGIVVGSVVNSLSSKWHSKNVQRQYAALVVGEPLYRELLDHFPETELQFISGKQRRQP